LFRVPFLPGPLLSPSERATRKRQKTNLKPASAALERWHVRRLPFTTCGALPRVFFLEAHGNIVGGAPIARALSQPHLSTSAPSPLSCTVHAQRDEGNLFSDCLDTGFARAARTRSGGYVGRVCRMTQPTVSRPAVLLRIGFALPAGCLTTSLSAAPTLPLPSSRPTLLAGERLEQTHRLVPTPHLVFPLGPNPSWPGLYLCILWRMGNPSLLTGVVGGKGLPSLACF
jgi:hypothetical protein